MRILNQIIILITFLIAGCNQVSEVNKHLVKVDSLLYNNCVDSANMILKNIEPQTKEDSAYYFVLKAETDYRQRAIPDINEINYSINHYETHINNRNLANAYFYKACVYFIIKDTLPKECFTILKQAEQTSEKTSDDYLKNKIYAALSYANFSKNLTTEALKYAKKEYDSALKINRRRNIAYAEIRLSVCYRDLNLRDSAEYYIMQCKAFANDVDNDDRAYIYNLLGECFMMDNLDAAHQYFITALKYKTLPETYKNLATLYYEKNDTLNWRKYCDSALANAWYESKIDILSDIAHKNYEAKDLDAYKKTTDKTIETWKDFMNYEKQNLSLEIQKKYDFDKQHTEYERDIWILIAIICILILASLVFYMIHRHNLRKIKQLENDNAQLYEKQKVFIENLDEYKTQLVFLQKQNEELSCKSNDLVNIIDANKQMIATLQHKVDEMDVQNNEYLAVGKNIFDRMSQNLPISDYKERFANCLYYFETIHPDKTNIFDSYINLTIENKVFLICDDFLGKDDEQISKIFKISQTTVRTRRSKMKIKLS